MTCLPMTCRHRNLSTSQCCRAWWLHTWGVLGRCCETLITAQRLQLCVRCMHLSALYANFWFLLSALWFVLYGIGPTSTIEHPIFSPSHSASDHGMVPHDRTTIAGGGVGVKFGVTCCLCSLWRTESPLCYGPSGVWGSWGGTRRCPRGRSPLCSS